MKILTWKEKLLTSRRLNYLSLKLEEGEFNYQNPQHLSAVVRALQRYPTVDGVVIGGLKEVLIEGRPLEMLKELSEIRRKLESLGKVTQPPGDEKGKISRKCSTCPSHPTKVLGDELKRYDGNPLEWRGRGGVLKGRSLPQCRECIKRTENILKELSTDLENVFRRIELLG